MNSQENGNIAMSENIIIADADYVDSVAFNLIVNFERMLNRALPKADFEWGQNGNENVPHMTFLYCKENDKECCARINDASWMVEGITEDND